MTIGFIGLECISEKEIISILKDFSGCKMVYRLTTGGYNTLYIYGEMPEGSEYESLVDNELLEGDATYEELKAKFESK